MEIFEKVKDFLKENTLELVNGLENLQEAQKSFLETNIGQAINTGVDFGLKTILPDFMEDDIIEIKDALLNEGIKEAINVTIDNAIDLGKSFMGIFTGTFENISQIKTAIQKGGLIDGISNVLDSAISFAKEKGYIDSKQAKLIKEGKNEIIESISNGVDSTLSDQVEAIEKIDGYIEKWNKYYEEQNFTNMEYQYNKIQEYLEKVVPLEDVLTKARQLENIHTLIKNNGKDFNLTEQEKELANILI